MSTMIDLRFKALTDAGYTGSTSDMLKQWLAFETGTLSALPLQDLWRLYLISVLAIPEAEYHRSDFWYLYLELMGYEGAIQEKEYQFWLHFNINYLLLETGDALLLQSDDKLLI